MTMEVSTQSGVKKIFSAKAHTAPRRAFVLGALTPMMILLLIYWKLGVWPLGEKTLLRRMPFISICPS